jgi:hypothetical protein
MSMCHSCSRVPKLCPASNLRKIETTVRVRKGVIWVTLTSDSPSAHPHHEVYAHEV